MYRYGYARMVCAVLLLLAPLLLTGCDSGAATAPEPTSTVVPVQGGVGSVPDKADKADSAVTDQNQQIQDTQDSLDDTTETE